MGLIDDAQTESGRLLAHRQETARREAEAWAEGQRQFDEVMNEAYSAVPVLREKVEPLPIVVKEADRTQRTRYSRRGDGWIGGALLITTEGTVYSGRLTARSFERPTSEHRVSPVYEWDQLGDLGIAPGAQYIESSSAPLTLERFGEVRLETHPTVEVVWRARSDDGPYRPLREALVSCVAQILAE